MITSPSLTFNMALKEVSIKIAQGESEVLPKGRVNVLEKKHHSFETQSNKSSDQPAYTAEESTKRELGKNQTQAGPVVNKSKTTGPSCRGIILGGNDVAPHSFKFLQVFLFCGPHTTKKARFFISDGDYIDVWILIDITKLKLMTKMAYYMCQGASVMSFTKVSCGKVMALEKPTKEKEHCRDQYN